MSETSGKRVVGKKIAPTLFVVYQCVVCDLEATLDAYDGPPSCLNGHKKQFMQPLRLMETVDG